MSRKTVEFLPDACWFLFWGVLSSFWCITAANRLSATFDEPFQLESALKSWRTGSFKTLLDVGTMPLPLWVNTAPLYVWERWQGRPFDFRAEMDKLLPVARTMSLVFWWLLLGYSWVAARQIAGTWGGRLAVVILCCEPTVLAHAALATADIALAACLLAFFVHYRLGRSRGWLLRVGVPASWFAAAVLTKASGLIFGLLGAAVFEIEYRLRERTDLSGLPDRVRVALAAVFDAAFRRRILQVFWIGLGLVFVFCGSDWKASPSFVKWAHTLPEGAGGDSMRWVSEHLCVFSNAGNGLGYQIRRNLQKDQDGFLLGAAYHRSLWYYYPVALSIKLTLPFLLLPLLLASLSPRSLRNWSCVMAGILLVYSVTCRVQLGVRLLLPLVGLAAVGLGGALATALREAPDGWRRRALASVALAVPLWMAGASWSVWPNGLCYVNEVWGGTAEGYKLVSDSNYDWGQGLKELRAWQRHNGVEMTDIVYFGSDPSVDGPSLHLVEGNLEKLRNQARGPYLAVGTSFVYGPLDDHPNFKPFSEWVRGLTPVARTSTFLIFDLRQTGLMAKSGR